MNLNTWQKVAVTTILSTIFLIFVGGLVRASGAGLGCPDWPTCFGMWIPPVSAADLPAGYDPAQFNVYKTWTEYLNRLVGVIIGLLITATFLLSFRYRKDKPTVFYSSLAAFILVIIQGWLGGRVVMTGLDAWLITLHMVLAMLILTVLLYALFRSGEWTFRFSIGPQRYRMIWWSALAVLVLTVIQMILGTQVREAVDVIKNAAEVPPRDQWIARIGAIDEIHRTFSWVLLAASALLCYLTWWKREPDLLTRLGGGIFVIVILQILLGIGLYYLEMPPSFQVLHLTGIAVMIVLEFLLIMVLRNSSLKGGSNHFAEEDVQH